MSGKDESKKAMLSWTKKSRRMRVERDFSWEEVGDRIRSWRRAAGLTQSELAVRTRLTQAGIAAVEGGSHEPRLVTLRKIAQVLRRSTRELICGDPPKPAGAVSGMQVRVRRVVESDHQAAVAVFRKGLEAAELMLSSRSWAEPNSRRGVPKGMSPGNGRSLSRPSEWH